jgi:branched-chain amino acid transport system substrate-binding protein
MSAMRDRTALAALLALAILLPSGAGAADPYEISVLLPMTGGAGFLGKSASITLGAFQEYINQRGGVRGRPLKFAILDDASNPQVVVQLTNALVARKVPVIIGSSFAATCSAEMALLKNGPLAFCLSNAVSPPPQSFMYATLVTTANHIIAGLRFARLKGYKRVAAIVSTDTTGQQGEHDLNAALALDENKGLSLLDIEHFANADLSVAAQIARIKATNPELIVVWTTGVAAGTVLRGLSDAALLDVPVLISPGNATYAQMDQYAQFLPKSLYFTLPAAVLPDHVTDAATKARIAQLRQYLTAAGVKPDISSAAAWDSSLIMVSALDKLGFNASAEDLRAYVAGLKNFTGTSGRYDFQRLPQRGIGEDSEYVGRWDASKNAWVGVSKAGGFPL